MNNNELVLSIIQDVGMWAAVLVGVILLYRLAAFWLTARMGDKDVTRNVDWLLARTQVGIAVLFAIGFFAILFFLMMYHKEMSTTEITILTGLLSSLATIVALQQNFLYARTRPAGIPAPPPVSPPAAGNLSLSVTPGDPNASPPTSSSATASTGATAHIPV